MALRETLNENPGITTAATAVIILGALGFIFMSWMGGSTESSAAPTRAFFSDDDGRSWFIDDVNKIPPFARNGRQAVRAQLFTCDGGRNKFVGWLERYSPEGMQRMQASTRPGEILAISPDRAGLELKKPGTGDTGWVKFTDADAVARITDVRCPDGTKDKLEPILNP